MSDLRFETYRKWFQALLVKEFMELPAAEQERFIPLVEKFLADCRKVAEEGRSIKERRIQVRVSQVSGDTAMGEFEGKTLRFPKDSSRIGDQVFITVFSFDGEMWYSSKRELITGR